MFENVLALSVGIALAACTGLRAFLPLLVAGLLGRFAHLDLASSFAFLSSTPALIALAVATLVEVAADKVPALDHALDAIQTPVRVVAGACVAAAALAHVPTWAAVLLGLVAGAPTALGVHATKATLRAGSTATTLGTANPVLSILEDLLCFAGSVLSPLFAVFACFVAAVSLVVLVLVVRALLRRVRRARTESASPERSS